MGKADEIFKKHQQIKEISTVKNTTNVLLGKLLYELRKDGNFEIIAGDDATFHSYLADPEINISPTTAYRDINVYKKYILELGLSIKDIDHLDIMKLYQAKNDVTKSNIDEWLPKIETLSRSDIGRLVKYPDVDPMSCEHAWEAHKEKCNKCGEIKGVK